MIKEIFNKGLLKKLTALSTAAAFLFTGAFAQSGYAFIKDKDSVSFDEAVNNEIPVIPQSIGKITSAKYFDSGDIVINIQDLHCHAETQRNVAKIIGYIDGLYKLDKVYLEGAVGSVDTDWLTSLNKTEIGKRTIESLVNLGQLSGTEYYSALNGKKNFIKGIENEQIYKENIKLLKEIINLSPETDAVCKKLNDDINKIRKDYLNGRSKRLEKVIEEYKTGKISAKKYYAFLGKTAEKAGVSLDKYKNVKLYSEILDKTKNVNNEKVAKEFKIFVNALKSQLPYKQYAELLQTSNNFTNIENVSAQLSDLSARYDICGRYKLRYLQDFLICLNFNNVINPVEFVKEEKKLINELYSNLSETKYEKEVVFLS